MLTHTKPFPKALQVRVRVEQQVLNELLANKKIKEFKPIKKYLKAICPLCGGTTLRERKIKTPKFVCTNCKHEFENPHLITNENNAELKKQKREYYKQALQKYEDVIEKRYTKEMERLRNWYLSGEDTITLCSTCSYNYKMGRVLCKECKQNYHSKQYDRCFICNSVKCKKCDNRILISKNQTICNECKQKEKTLCPICKKNLIAEGLKLCEDCILQGYWID